MEKIRPPGKNETYQEYNKAIKEKLDEIVEFLGTVLAELPPPPDTDDTILFKEPDGD